MKQTMKTLLALMAGTIALAACSEDAILENNETQLPEQTEVARKHITFTAMQEDNGATRAAISSGNATQIVWSAGDRITVLYRDANTLFGFDNVDFSLTGGANTTNGTFDGEVLETVTDETVYTALYPCHTKNEGTIEVTWEDLTEDEQDEYYNCLAPWGFDQESLDWDLEVKLITQEQYDHIMAYVKGETVSVNNSVTLTADGKITDVSLPAVQTATEGSFDPATALMMAQTTGSTDAMEFKNVASYFKFVAPFDCSNVQIFDNAKAGQMAGTVTLDYNSGEPTATVTANGASSITLTGAIEEGKTYYIATLPQTFSQGITMHFDKSDGTDYVKRTNSSYTLGRNKVSNMGTPAPSVINTPYVTFSAASTQTLTMSQAVEGLQYSVGGGAWATLGTSTVTFGGTGNDLRLRGTNGYGTAKDNNNFATVMFGESTTPVACSGDIRTLVNYLNYETASTANARFCYLFWLCSNLTTAPALPATELADYCYYFMFNKCNSLTVAPALPATELAGNCYNFMFGRCTSLTQAPELPAETLKIYCYYSMFYQCSSLNYVKAAFTTSPTAVHNSTLNWLDGVAATGTFVKNPNATWDVRGASGVPEGWTVTTE